MSGNICQYVNCNVRKKYFPNLKLYRFPVNNTTQLKRWIINSGICNTYLYYFLLYELAKIYKFGYTKQKGFMKIFSECAPSYLYPRFSKLFKTRQEPYQSNRSELS